MVWTGPDHTPDYDARMVLFTEKAKLLPLYDETERLGNGLEGMDPVHKDAAAAIYKKAMDAYTWQVREVMVLQRTQDQLRITRQCMARRAIHLSEQKYIKN
jgi:hypothetical protein